MIYDLAHGDVALLVIDVQNEYFKAGGVAAFDSAEAILDNVNALVEGFRAKGRPVVFVQHLHRADGADAGRMGDFTPPGDEASFVEGTPEVGFHPRLAYRPADMVVVKRRYSAFAGTDLDQILRTLRVRSIVVTGLMTSFCCESTARDGQARDYEVIFVSDANEGPDLVDVDGRPVGHDEVLRATMTALSAGFAEIVPTAGVLARLG